MTLLYLKDKCRNPEKYYSYFWMSKFEKSYIYLYLISFLSMIFMFFKSSRKARKKPCPWPLGKVGKSETSKDLSA
jgi:hypothetical protein